MFCSNRGQRGGCGRTFSLMLAEVLPRHTFIASHLWSGLVEVLTGLSVKAAAEKLQMPFALESVYRLRRRLRQRLDALRSRLCREQPPPASAQSDPFLQTIEHLQGNHPNLRPRRLPPPSHADPGRCGQGKIERFFRTVRDQFLARQLDLSSLDALTRQFTLWVEEDYNARLHSVLGMSPLDRYALDRCRVRFLPPNEANDELFFVEESGQPPEIHATPVRPFLRRQKSP